MSRQAFVLTVVLVLTLTLPFAAVAQRHGGPGADPATAFEVFGPVVSFTAAAGAGMPALGVEDSVLGLVEVGLGPVWFLKQQGFSAAPGDEVELLAYACATCSLPAVAAWVSNLTAGVSIELRDAEGSPLWRARGGGRGGHPRCEPDASDEPGAAKMGPNGSGGGPHGGGDPGNGPDPGDGHPGDGGPGNGPGPGPGGPGEGPGDGGPGDRGPHGGQCSWTAPDMSATATVEGVVVAVAAMPGEGTPSMVLAAGDGNLELLLSPYHPIAAAGFLIEPGMELTVVYAPWVVGGEELLATISITDPVTGLTLQLRDPETGYPIRGYHGHGRP